MHRGKNGLYEDELFCKRKSVLGFGPESEDYRLAKWTISCMNNALSTSFSTRKT
jgi:hypothetical protein